MSDLHIPWSVAVATDMFVRAQHRLRSELATALYATSNALDNAGEWIDPQGPARAARRDLVVQRYGRELLAAPLDSAELEQAWRGGAGVR